MTQPERVNGHEYEPLPLFSLPINHVKLLRANQGAQERGRSHWHPELVEEEAGAELHEEQIDIPNYLEAFRCQLSNSGQLTQELTEMMDLFETHHLALIMLWRRIHARAFGYEPNLSVGDSPVAGD